MSEFHNGLAQIAQYGFMDINGNIVIEAKYDEVSDFQTDKYTNEVYDVAFVKKNDLWGLIDKNGNVVVEPQYTDWCGFVYGITVVKKNGKAGYIDVSGKVIVEPIFSEAYSFRRDKTARVKIDYKHSGIIDTNGEYLAPPIFSQIYDKYLDRRLIQVGKQWGLMDENSRIVIPPIFTDVNQEEYYNSIHKSEESGRLDLEGFILR